MATTYTAVAAGGLWSANSTWGGAGHPVAGDTAIINATMTGTVTIDAASACATLNMTNNGGTLAFSTFGLTVSAATTLSGTMTCSSAATITITGGGCTLASTTGSPYITLTFTTAGGTLTSGGFTWGGNLTFGYAGTYVLSGNWITTYLTTFSAASVVNKTTADTYTCNGGLTLSASSGSGNAVFYLSSSQTITASTYTLANPLHFNTTGTITFVSNLIVTGLITVDAAFNSLGTYNLTSTGGGITLASSTGTITNLTLNFTTAGCTLTSGGFTWGGNVNFNYGGTYVLSGNWITTGLTTFSQAAIVNKTSADTYTCNGGLTIVTISAGAGNAVFYLSASQTLNFGTYTLPNQLHINTTGTITFASNAIVTGLVSIDAAFNSAGAYTLTCNGGVTLNAAPGSTHAMTLNPVGNLTSNGYTCYVPIKPGAVTLYGSWVNAALVTIGGATINYHTSAAETFTCSNGMYMGPSSTGTGTAIVYFTGGVGGGAGAILYHTLIITPTTSNITFAAGSSFYMGGASVNISYVASAPRTVSMAGFTLGLYNDWGGTISFPVDAYFTGIGGLTFYSAARTLTLTSNLVCNGLVNWNYASTVNGASYQLICNAGLTLGNNILGSVGAIVLTGGTYTNTNNTMTIAPPFTINPTTSNITCSPGSYIVPKNTVTFIHGSYSVSMAGSSLYLGTAISITCDDGSGHMVWDVVTFSAAVTITMASKFWCNQLSNTSGYNITFTGAYNISCVSLYLINAAASTLSLTYTAGQYLLISGSIDIASNTTYPITVQSSTTSVSYITYTGSLQNMNIANANFTYINAASSSNPLYNFGTGTLSNTTNIKNINLGNYTSLDVVQKTYLPFRGRVG